jgi:hypothetical protein
MGRSTSTGTTMIKLELTIEQVNAILGHLGRLPYEQVHLLIEEIVKQGKPQAEAIEAAQAEKKE